VAVILAVALVPAAALAQNGAGDEQYQDPFAGGSSQPAAKPKPKPQPTQQQSQPAQQATPQPTTTASSSQQPAARSGELPRTGFDLVPVALAGAALVAAGLALRRRAAHGRD
jgi:LPXTG-motif cell wall-anchored protein